MKLTIHVHKNVEDWVTDMYQPYLERDGQKYWDIDLNIISKEEAPKVYIDGNLIAKEYSGVWGFLNRLKPSSTKEDVEFVEKALSDTTEFTFVGV